MPAISTDHAKTRLLLTAALCAFAAAHTPVNGAETELSDNPLSSSSTSQVKPNILFVLDDSGSMDREYMPDEVDSGEVGYRNYQCNTVYYNPAVNYTVPKDGFGVDLHSAAPATYTAACSNGYSSSACSTSLGTKYYWEYVGTNTALAWPLSGDNDCTLGSSIDITAKTGVCKNGATVTTVTNSPPTCTAPATLVWKRVTVTSASADAQNYANWYSYYRSRLMTMKGAAGRAFTQIGDSYRVGFMTIETDTPLPDAKFLPIADFTVGTTGSPGQKPQWFSKLYSQDAPNFTPLRRALSRAGRYYAGKTDGIAQGLITGTAPKLDPIQYSCQQNFTILTTDGYWNSEGGVKLDGTAMVDALTDNQDGDITELDAYNPTDKKFLVSPDPINDGATAAYAWHALQKEYRNTTSGCSSGKRKRQYRYNDVTTYYQGPGQTGSVISTTTTSTSWTTDVNCTSNSASYAVPSPNPQSLTGAKPGGCSLTACDAAPGTWPCETASSTGGTSNTLADVAQHYYKTDLRYCNWGSLTPAQQAATGQTEKAYCHTYNTACRGALGADINVCDNNVPATGTGVEDDKAPWQHMTTFTMGLGVSGDLQYRSDYKTATSGDYYDIKNNLADWPAPSENDPTAVDDLWHAAVNGRGQYFSAANPDAVVNALTSALSGINARVASAAAAATSNLEPVAGDNFAYTAKYVTQRWTGELEAREIDLASGQVSGTALWSAATKLDALTKNACDNRVIKLFRSGATNNLVDFKWNTYACDGNGDPTGSAVTALNATEQAYFDSSEVMQLSQYANLGDGTAPTVNQRAAAAGANLVNFVRGQRGKEGFESGPPATNEDLDLLYRAREHVLGDIVNAQPVFVKAPFAQYLDSGYSDFRTDKSGRTPMVYVAANDGMLHAFYAGSSAVDTQGGVEAWAFMPTIVLPNLFWLASENYANQHKFSVDGTPTAADVFDTTASADCAAVSPATPKLCWKTILVGGLNKGGKGYYALDVTDPAAPKALWEFKQSSTCYDSGNSTTWGADCHIGYTFNNPIVAKLANGTWAVFVTSGYNNVNSPSISGDGVGYLYVLNAMTGKIIYKISTGVGSAATPSGLNHINAWVDNGLVNNTVSWIYGVDLEGNIWRFDVNDSGTLLPAGREATRVATLVDSSGTVQPITTRPEVAEISGTAFVLVGTGRYLGTADITNTQTQTVWAIKDTLTTTAVANIRSTLGQRTINNVGSGLTAYRTVTADGDGCVVGEGWYADLPDERERVNIDVKLQLGTLVVPSNVPVSNACNIGGYGWLNYFNYKTGCAVATATDGKVGQKTVGASGTESLAVGTNIVRLPGGKTVVIVTTSAAEQLTFDVPFDTPAPTGKRVSWREILQ
jgi:type IV pilus assembly protein PilY1